MTREEALQTIKAKMNYLEIKAKMDYYESDRRLKCALETLIPELAESEDERIRKSIIECVKEQIRQGNYLNINGDKAIAYLEKQKEQKPDDDPLDDPKFINGFDTGREVQRIFDEQKPAEWSEEDEANFKWFDKLFRAESVVIGGKDIPQDKYLWFKHLRPSWKPSEEQMETLRLSFEDAFNDAGDCNRYRRLKSLYNDLKKLM